MSRRLNVELMEHLKKKQAEILASLEKDARRLCHEAAATKETRNRTGAQLNSFFWLVCYDGIIKSAGWNDDLHYESSTGKGHKGLDGTWWTEGNGEDWANHFLEAVGKPLGTTGAKTKTAKGYEIYIIDAAYYTDWLEMGNKNSPINFGKYHIISQIKSDCEQVAREYATKLHTKAKVVRLGIAGDEPFRPATFSSKKE